MSSEPKLQAMSPPVSGVQQFRVGAAQFQFLARALRSVDFFYGLKLPQLERILPSISLYRYPEGHEVIQQGDEDQALFVLYRGRVVISRRRPWRLFATPVKSLLPGDFFGEMALLYKKPRSATVTTTEESDIFVLMADDFRYILEKNRELERHIRQVADKRKFEIEQWERQ